MLNSNWAHIFFSNASQLVVRLLRVFAHVSTMMGFFFSNAQFQLRRKVNWRNLHQMKTKSLIKLEDLHFKYIYFYIGICTVSSALGAHAIQCNGYAIICNKVYSYDAQRKMLIILPLIKFYVLALRSWWCWCVGLHNRQFLLWPPHVCYREDKYLEPPLNIM